MSEEHKRMVQQAACTCEAFLHQCGISPETVPTSKLYELVIIYHEYGPDGVRDYLNLSDIGDGGIPELT
tara:strand:+ start:496 stop:702 length:207 start_codon:yes stop_codon:yes gene_type:complete